MSTLTAVSKIKNAKWLEETDGFVATPQNRSVGLEVLNNKSLL